MEASVQLRELVAEYSRVHLSATKRAFIVHAPQLWKQAKESGGWRGSDQAKKAGCYVIFNEAGCPLWIGKASGTQVVGTRLNVHEKKNHANLEDAHFVQIIEVNEPFEAPSLEEYLVLRIRPKWNKVGLRIQLDGD